MVGDELRNLVTHVQFIVESFNQAAAVYAEKQRKIEVQIKTFCAMKSEAINKISSQITDSFVEVKNIMGPIVKKKKKAFNELPERNQNALRIFAENGWYVDPELSLPDLFEIADLFEIGNKESAHQKLCDHFEFRLDGIQDNICGRFSNRSRVLYAAFNAHRKGEYALSVPVLLSQADGICKDLVGAQLYARRDGIPMLASYLPVDNGSPFSASLYSPIVEPFPISAGSAERSNKTDLLFRHSIMHGEQCDYDTRVNSYRSISLLVYVCWMLGEQ